MSDPISNLNEIKQMMKQSSKFTSISGWSGVWVGCVGFVASFFANRFINNLSSFEENEIKQLECNLFILGIVALVVALVGGLFFINQKTKKEGQHIFSFAGKKIIFKFFQPLLIGGVLILTLIYQGYLDLIAPFTLLFYGFSLLFASTDTVKEMKFLAYLFILLGLVSVFYPNHSLLFWTIGFGALHLVFGLIFLIKYDLKK